MKASILSPCLFFLPPVTHPTDRPRSFHPYLLSYTVGISFLQLLATAHLQNPFSHGSKPTACFRISTLLTTRPFSVFPLFTKKTWWTTVTAFPCFYSVKPLWCEWLFSFVHCGYFGLGYGFGLGTGAVTTTSIDSVLSHTDYKWEISLLVRVSLARHRFYAVVVVY